MNKTITSWSYSRLATWKQCPYKAKLLMIDKLQEPTNEAMQRGSDIHKKLENYMGDGRKVVFKEMGPYKDYLKGIRQNRDKYSEFHTEMQVAFNKELAQVDWFAWNAWLRAVIDLYIVEDDKKHATIIDYKTGRRKNDHVDQADMYAAVFYLLNKDKFNDGILSIKFLYVDQPNISEMLEKTYTIKACELHLKRFVKLGTAMTNDKSFKATPSNMCKWCHFRKSNNGPCKF